ncbi:hypothetical protein BHE74_00043213, partial [Ensete ventricosum]
SFYSQLHNLVLLRVLKFLDQFFGSLLFLIFLFVICRHASENKRLDLFDGPDGGDVFAEENVLLASSMTNQQLMDTGHGMIDETDQAIERSKKVVEETVNVGAETAASLKAQTEQMSRIVNELDSIHFSIKKASQLVKEIGRQVATDRCIMGMLFLIVIGVVTIIIVKVGCLFGSQSYL